MFVFVFEVCKYYFVDFFGCVGYVVGVVVGVNEFYVVVYVV